MNKEESIGFQIKTLSNLIKRNIFDNNILKSEKDITPMQAWIIHYIFANKNKGDIFQNDIEKEFNIRRSTATSIFQNMEKSGYIIRETATHDARLKKLILTNKAMEVNDKATAYVSELEQRLRKGLSPGELVIFFEIIQKIRNNIEE